MARIKKIAGKDLDTTYFARIFSASGWVSPGETLELHRAVCTARVNGAHVKLYDADENHVGTVEPSGNATFWTLGGDVAARYTHKVKG